MSNLSQQFKRSGGGKILDIEDVEIHNSISHSSDSVKEIKHKPFDLDFEMTEQEMNGLADAFHRYMDVKDKKISFNELFHDLKAIDI